MAQPSPVTVHTPHRPSWDCLVCHEPWPCDPARDELRADHDHVQVAVYMWQQLEDAVHDLPPAPAVVFFERFIKWTG
ncbi:hypothetical protein BC793_106243 [Actinoplanes xinjiangensis]|uniref:Flavin reductase n=1 Tax=Actinoplanes xinjiangensis TaxID=512350 RepID=A0A316FIV3_9ACTN|nr:hypothetical protein BC793_106243 [Actinoplanes xinjiangensis]GIF39034.1 hypothetical protein Axi01nite_33450 [Actinoplanes xinjiangensis]